MDKLNQETLIKAQIDIAESLKGIRENLKQLNDNNILHTTETKNDHNRIINMLKIMTDKYWWLILILLGVLSAIAGYKNIISLI